MKWLTLRAEQLHQDTKDETLLTDLQLWWMTNALLLCSLIVGEWMCLIWRERCRCYRRYNSQLRCESPRQTLTSVKETQSTPLFTLCRRCLPAWRRLPSLLCIWLQGSGSKRGSQEAGSGRPVWWNALRCYRESRERFTVRSAFTLQILADVMFQGDAPLTQEGGRCIAQGLADRSRRSWWSHADSSWWPFSCRRESSKLRYNKPSDIKISLNTGWLF